VIGSRYGDGRGEGGCAGTLVFGRQSVNVKKVVNNRSIRVVCGYACLGDNQRAKLPSWIGPNCAPSLHVESVP
jgi:hypothetical protein